MPTPEVTRALVQELAHLARLQLPPDRAAEALGRLGRVLEAFRALSEVELGDAEPDPYPVPMACPLRADEPGAVLPRAEVLRNAAETAADAFLLPRVVEG